MCTEGIRCDLGSCGSVGGSLVHVKCMVCAEGIYYVYLQCVYMWVAVLTCTQAAMVMF